MSEQKKREGGDSRLKPVNFDQLYPKSRKRGGGKLIRSETVTMRLDPKLRYLAELAARKQRRSLSSFIEWAVEDSLQQVLLYEDTNFHGEQSISIADVASQLWDVDDADRFAKLALSYPDMLTHDEQILWKLVRENGYLWRGRFPTPNGIWTWKVEQSSLLFERLRENWEKFCAVAKGQAERSILPSWPKRDLSPDCPDSDLPF